MHTHFQLAARILLAGIAAFGSGVVTLRADPSPPTNTVFRPTFATKEGPVLAGTAFVCEWPDGGSHLLLTVHHLFGPGGGMEKEVPWDRLPEVVSRVTAQSLQDPSHKITSRKVLTIPDAKALDDAGWEHDIAAFALEPDKARPVLKLAKAQPKVGDRVWLFGQLPGSAVTKLYAATVVVSNEKRLDYRFDQRSVRFRGTSGAPILDAKGDVVAVNVGGGVEDGIPIGIGNPTPSVIVHLKRIKAN